MTSSDSSFSSTKAPNLLTLETLLADSERLRSLAEALKSQVWRVELRPLLEMEQQAHLEQASFSDDSEDREGHRLVARWLKAFFEITIPSILAADLAQRTPNDQPTEHADGGSDWVVRSSDGYDIDERETPTGAP